MDVNQTKDDSHLLLWAASEAALQGYTLGIYTLKAVLDTGAFSLILKNIDEEYFQSSNSQQDNP